MEKQEGGCVSAAGGILDDNETHSEQPTEVLSEKKGDLMTARLGRPAPDFEATAYFNNDFTNIKLSDYKGKWIVLCFYPGDFTFV